LAGLKTSNTHLIATLETRVSQTESAMTAAIQRLEASGPNSRRDPIFETRLGERFRVVEPPVMRAGPDGETFFVKVQFVK
jgi:hypothetical protein